MQEGTVKFFNDSKGFALDRIETEINDLKGARYYTYKG